MENNILSYNDFLNEFSLFKNNDLSLYSKNITNDFKKWMEKSKITSTEIIATQSKKPNNSTQLISHFGGDPYFDQDEKWPETTNGKRMEFICQIISNKLQNGIKIIQIYFDPDSNDTYRYFAKSYKKISNKPKLIENNIKTKYSVKYADIKFKDFLDYPVYYNVEYYNFLKVMIKKYSKSIENYIETEHLKKISNKLSNIRSKINGYNNCIQGDMSEGNMEFILQICNNRNLNLNIFDDGNIYVYNDNNKIIAYYDFY